MRDLILTWKPVTPDLKLPEIINLLVRNEHYVLKEKSAANQLFIYLSLELISSQSHCRRESSI